MRALFEGIIAIVKACSHGGKTRPAFTGSYSNKNSPTISFIEESAGDIERGMKFGIAFRALS